MMNSYNVLNTAVYNVFDAGLYLRLSRDDGNVGESESIQNQKTFLMKFAVDNGFNLVDIYIDDGWSGLNYERPEFKRMIADIEGGKINCVITKDLSRLGRDYIMTGHYLERYFPEHGIRYIAVNDGVDTASNNTSNDMTPFRAVFNDMYAKDISKKVRTALETKKASGLFVGSVAPYGYKKDQTNKNHLVIDEETAYIVRKIYSMFIGGKTIHNIASQLSAEHIPTPSAIKGLSATQKAEHKGLWNDGIIERILTNPTYIGNLTQNRSRKINYKVQKKRNLPKEQWIISEGTHEAIISNEDFETVQSIISKKRYKPKRTKMHLLSGLIKCSDCHGTMTFSDDRDGRCYLVCANSRRYYKEKMCTSHRIREDYVEKELIGQLKEAAKYYLDKDKILEKCNNNSGKENELSKEFTRIENRLSEISKMITSLYADKIKGIITENDFIEMNKSFNNERSELSKQMSEIEQRLKEMSNVKADDGVLKKILEQFLLFETVEPNMLAVLVDKIEIFEGKKIKIYFNFSV